MSEKNNYFIISDSRFFEQKLSAIEIAVYIRICMRAHKSICFESIKNIAQACSLSERSVRSAFLKLKSLNMIEIFSGKESGKPNSIILIPYENWVKLKEGVGTSCLPGRHLLPTGSAPPTYRVGTTCRHNSTHVNRTQNQDSFNAVAVENQKTAAKKKKKTYLLKNKSKLWSDKNEEEKFESLLSMAKDSHAGGVRQNKNIKPFPFEDFPDLLFQLVKEYGLETLKELFDYGKDIRKGFNVRWLKAELEEMFEKKSKNIESIAS